MSEKKINEKKTALKNGAYLGLGLGIIALIATYLLDWDAVLTTWWFQPFNGFLVVAASFFTAYQLRKLKVTNLTFKKLFSVYFITMVCGTLLFTLSNSIVYHELNPEAGEYLKQSSIAQLEKNKKDTQTNIEGIKEGIEKLEKQKDLEDAEDAIKDEKGKLERNKDVEKRINENIKSLEETDLFALGHQFKGYIFNIALYSVFGAIIALILKPKKPIVI